MNGHDTEPSQHAHDLTLLDLVAALLHSSGWQGQPIAHEALRRHHLSSLAHLAGVPGLRDTFANVSVLAAMLRLSLQELREVFASQSLTWTTIKGANYAFHLYADPAHRPMSDLDLMVPEEHFDAAVHALKSIGFWERGVTRHSRHAQTFVRRPHELIDLHRSILQPWRRNSRPQAYWSRARANEDFTGSVLFSDVDMALIHIAHMARHEFIVPLISFIDLQRLLARLAASQRAELDERLAEGELIFAFRALEQLQKRLSGDSPVSQSARMRLVLPHKAELITGRHRSRKRQIARKLGLFPSDAATLLSGYCVRTLGDYLIARTMPRDSRVHSFHWRR